jgi:hypothetical protein
MSDHALGTKVPLTVELTRLADIEYPIPRMVVSQASTAMGHLCYAVNRASEEVLLRSQRALSWTQRSAMCIPGAILTHYVQKAKYGKYAEVKGVGERYCELAAAKNEEGEA